MNWFTWANLVTSVRLIIVPFVVIAVCEQDFPRAILLFLVAALSDGVDGQLARRLQQESLVGSYLDPIADKILIASCYGALLCAGTHCCEIPVSFFLVVFMRDVLLVLGGLYLVITKSTVSLQPSWLGKVTTALQLCFIMLVFIAAAFHIPVQGIATFLMAMITGCVITSFVEYSYRAFFQGLLCRSNARS